MISTHFTDFLLIRAPIQSMVRLARSSSSSRHAFSISMRSEKRKANEGCETVVNVVVLVFTEDPEALIYCTPVDGAAACLGITARMTVGFLKAGAEQRTEAATPGPVSIRHRHGDLGRMAELEP